MFCGNIWATMYPISKTPIHPDDARPNQDTRNWLLIHWQLNQTNLLENRYVVRPNSQCSCKTQLGSSKSPTH